MIHPEATVDECMEEIGALERKIEHLEAVLIRFDKVADKYNKELCKAMERIGQLEALLRRHDDLYCSAENLGLNRGWTTALKELVADTRRALEARNEN